MTRRLAFRDGVYKLIRGRLYFDTRSGSRERILSLELEYNQQIPVVLLPIVFVL